MWRYQEWLEELGWDVEAPAQLGHGGRGPSPSYGADALRDDNLAMGDHDLVVGHSLGGATALMAAAVRPEWARRLVMVDPPWNIPGPMVAMVRDAQLAELDWTADDIRAQYPHWDDRDIEAKVFEASRADPGAVAGIFDQNPGWTMLQMAMTLPMPTLLITGDPAVDTMTSPADAMSVAEANRRLTWVTAAGTGHNPHRDDPEQVRLILLDWLEKTA